MRRNPLQSLLILAVAGVGLGCTGGVPKIGVDHQDGVYDFGATFPGSEALTQTIIVTNLSDRMITLSSVERADGDAVRIAGQGDPAALFSIDFTPTTLAPGRTASFTARFAASCDAAWQKHSTTIVFHVAGSTAVASATLRGSVVLGDFEGIGNLEFGNVQLGDVVTLGFTVRNPTSVPLTMTVDDIASGSLDARAFSFSSDAPRGTFTVPAGTDRDVSFDFHPTEAKSYRASVHVHSDVTCFDQRVALTGAGVDAVLTWAPSQIDCSIVPPGVTVTRELTFHNDANADVELSGIATADSTEFFVQSSSSGPDTSRLTVPGHGGTGTLTVACKPGVTGPRQTQLKFNTTLPLQPHGIVSIKVWGGGPRIAVSPSAALDFGKVAFFAGAHPATFSSRHLVVKNIGYASPSGDVNANLKFSDPAFEITPTNADTSADEFSVTVDPRYDPAVGIETTEGKNRAVLTVRVTPTSLGLKQAELKIHSNDPANPVVTIALSANAVVLPPCNYSVIDGTGLDFGLIPGGESRDLRFSVVNHGTTASDICLLSGLDLDPLSDAAFSLPEGPVDSIELAPGERRNFTVRARPQGATPAMPTSLQGQVGFSISTDVNGGWNPVPLEASTGSSCIAIAPNDFDFGTVKLGCNSLTRTFNLYDTCSTAVTVQSFQMVQGAGQVAGEPQCMGPSACPEFQLVQTPAIPAGGLTLNPGAPLTFQVSYKPMDEHPDLGAIAISVDQNGTSTTNLVNVRGNGSTSGIQTDTIAFPSKPKTDILFVIDNRPGMAADQASFAAQFAPFIKYAQSAQVDYRFGSISADMGALSSKGILLYGPFGPTAPDVATEFTSAIDLGDTGSANQMIADAAVSALTAPLINSDNAGFLRDDATLGVITLTVGPDLSPRTTTYYLERLWNVKGWNHRNQFTFSALAPFTPGCIQSRGSGDTGELAFYASQTRGDPEDLCALSANAAEKLGKSVMFRTDYFLTSAPDLSSGSMRVKIDGATIDPVDSRGAVVWSFDPLSNQLQFEPQYVPEPGQTLTISYPTVCGP